MVHFFLVIFVLLSVLLSSTSGNHVYKGDDLSEGSPSKKVVDFIVHIREAGEEYNEKIEVDPNKQTELFQVPAHPGVDRSDILHDFKEKFTVVRFPDSKNCYLFPLQNEQSAPKKLIRDLVKAKQMVITETRRIDTTWITDSEMTDRSVLGDELADFCAQYPIYRVKEAQETLKVTGIQAEGRTNRVRRQSGSGLDNGTALCPGGMDLNKANQVCSEPKLECKTEHTCSQIVKCNNVTNDTDDTREQRLRTRVRNLRRRIRFLLSEYDRRDSSTFQNGESENTTSRHFENRRREATGDEVGSLPSTGGRMDLYRMTLSHFLHHPRLADLLGRDSRNRSRCWNEHDIRLVTVCCKYICNNAGNSNSGTAEILQRRVLRFG